MAGISVGPTRSNSLFRRCMEYFFVAARCPVGTITPSDGSFLICKASGQAWFAAPTSTQVSSAWGGSSGAVSEWSTLNAAMICANLTPSDWFVPGITLLQNPAHACKSYWSYCPTWYHATTLLTGNCLVNCFINMADGSVIGGLCDRTCPRCVRAFRCVTY
jgi:hypothetical protein